MPDPVARSITARALLDTLADSSPDLVVVAEGLSQDEWIDVATGRATATGVLVPGAAGHVLNRIGQSDLAVGATGTRRPQDLKTAETGSGTTGDPLERRWRPGQPGQ